MSTEQTCITLVFVFQGYSRKATALNFLRRYSDAVTAYEEALKYDPENQQLKTELAKCQNELLGKYYVHVTPLQCSLTTQNELDIIHRFRWNA